MSTAVLPNPGANEDMEDVQCDSLRYDTPRMPEIYQALIDIDEEIGEEETEGLKFLCRDQIAVSKLDKAQTALEIFDMMHKLALIAENNYDYLLECLGRIHRVDLVKKLGFQPEAVRKHLPKFQKLLPFRTLLMDITEDLDNQEAEKIRFFLRGKIRKKPLNEKRSLPQLFIFLEQEGLLAHNNLDLLTNVLESIRRGDLVDMIREFQGIPPLQRHDPGLQRNASVVVPSQHEPHIIGSRPPPQEPGQQRQALVHSGSAGSFSGQDRNSQIERSVSAGTLSVSSDENNVMEVSSRRVIPEPLFLQIADDLKSQVDNLGIELGLSNVQLAMYSQQIPDVKERTMKVLQDWMTGNVDKGKIASGLGYVLGKLGCKNSEAALKQWIDSLSTSQVPSQQHSEFEPSGPPENTENVCVSFRNAQPPMLPEQIPQQNTDPAQVLAGLQQLNLNPNQLADQRCVAYVNNVGVYKQGNDFVANPGISQQLQPVVLPVTGQGQVIVSVPAVQSQGRQTQPLGGPQLPTYNMDKKPRGWCVILNNEKFYVDHSRGNNQGSESKEMPPRNGTERDAASLQYIFDKLGFIVRRHDNLTDTQMMNVLIDAAHNVDHTNFDCFVCCILTHGVLGHLYGSNGKLVSIKDLTATFQTNRCPTLAGKPKLFFLQACQGRDKMEGGEIQQDGPQPVPVSGDTVFTDNDGQKKEMIPNEADFLMGYATVPGYVSFRSRNHGSWYIRKLCELLEKYSGRYDLMTILVEVNNEVAAANASMDGGFYKQIPAPLVTLRKRIFFR